MLRKGRKKDDRPDIETVGRIAEEFGASALKLRGDQSVAVQFIRATTSSSVQELLKVVFDDESR